MPSDKHKITREAAINGDSEALTTWSFSLPSELQSDEDIKSELDFINQFPNANANASLYMKARLATCDKKPKWKEIFASIQKAADEFPIATFDLAQLADSGLTGANESGSNKFESYVLNFDLKLAVEFYESAAAQGFQPAIIALREKIYVPIVLALREFAAAVDASSEIDSCIQELELRFQKSYVSHFSSKQLNKKSYLKDMKNTLAAIVKKHFPEKQEINTAFEKAMNNMDPEPSMEELFQKALAGDFIAQTLWVYRLDSLSEKDVKEYSAEIVRLYNLSNAQEVDRPGKLLYLNKLTYLNNACQASLPDSNWDSIKKNLSALASSETFEFGYFNLALNYLLARFTKEINADAELTKTLMACSNESFLNHVTSNIDNPSIDYLRVALLAITEILKAKYPAQDNILKLFAEYKFSIRNKSPALLFSSLDTVGEDYDKDELFENALSDFSKIKLWKDWMSALYSTVTTSKIDSQENIAKFDLIIADTTQINSSRRANALYMKAQYLQVVIDFSHGNDYKGDIDDAWISDAYGKINESLIIAADEYGNAAAASDLALRFESGLTPNKEEFGEDNYEYEEAIKYFKKAKQLSNNVADDSLEKRLYVPIVEALTAVKTKAFKVYSKKPELLAEVNVFLKHAKSIYHLERIAFLKAKNYDKKAYTEITAKKINDLAIKSFSVHRHKTLRLFADIFFPILGLASLGLAYYVKRKLSGCFTFSGEKTKRRKIFDEYMKDLSVKENDTEAQDLAPKNP